MPDFEYQFLDSVRRSISRILPLFFQKNQVFGFIPLQHQQSRFSLQMDTMAAGWHQGFRAFSAQCCCSQTVWQPHTALGADLEGWVEEHLLQQVSYGASWRGKAAAGNIRAQLHQLCAAPARSIVAVLEPAEPSWRRSICKAEQRKMLLLLYYSLCFSLFQASLPVSPPGTELCHRQTLLTTQWSPYK